MKLKVSLQLSQKAPLSYINTFISSLTLKCPRVSLWQVNHLALDRVKSSGVRQSKIYKSLLGIKGLKEIVFQPFSAQGVSLWRVKSSGVRQSKICHYWAFKG